MAKGVFKVWAWQEGTSALSLRVLGSPPACLAP